MSEQARARLSVELGTLKPEWEAWCAHRGVTPSEGLRQFAAKAIESCTDRPDTRPSLLVRDGPGIRIGIGLTHTEHAYVRAAAYVSGFTANRWIVALIRAHFTNEPQLGNRELALLAQSNQQLATIRKLLGELLRRQDASPSRDTLSWEHTRVAIDAHLRTVARLLRSNLDRWSR
ncbi:hypothetical protein QZM64_14200 [Burkholderia cepacia]|nr:hypothetical protein [Burkholderia cepacia]MDN7440313.1 hypothetical protein [Burkholderia cepacia]